MSTHGEVAKLEFSMSKVHQKLEVPKNEKQRVMIVPPNHLSVKSDAQGML